MEQETTPIPATKTRKHYINNADFCQALLTYQAAVAESKKTGAPKPKIPNYIGECFMKIAEGLSHKPNFINYTYRDEMVGDGIENCLMYFENFDVSKSSNPFAYFTQIIYFAFLRRIQKEKKQLYIKHKVLERDILHMSIVEQQTEDTSSFTPSVKIDGSFIDNFVVDFENKLLSKKKQAKTRSAAKKVTHEEQ